MNLGGNLGNFVALDGGESHTQNKENGQKTGNNYADEQCVMYLRLPAKVKEGQGEAEKVLEGNRFAVLAAESEQLFRRRA